MKHTIEIEGLPEGYEVKNIKVTEKQPWDNGSIAALIYVKKKQPHRIFFEETQDVFHHGNSGYRKYKNGVIQFISHASGSDIGSPIWRIVEDSGENDD